MAGNYMDAPATRLAYDRDGSIGIMATAAGAITALTNTDLRALNDEGEGSPIFNSQSRIAIVFSEPWDLAAVFVALSGGSPIIETSKDTTTGIDGTWTVQATAASYTRDVRPQYRIASNLVTMISGSTSQQIRGIRLSFGSNTTLSVRAIHVYGDLSSTATQHRLDFRQVGTDAQVGPTYFDWGNVPRVSSADKTFRVKNLSSTKTANGVQVYPEALTPGVPSVPGMLLLSTDGTTFLPSISLGDMAPGAISGTLTVRRVVPSNAQVSVWSARLVADADSWT